MNRLSTASYFTIDQPPVSSNLIVSAESEADSSCIPDASSNKKRQDEMFDVSWNIFKKPKPEPPVSCDPRLARPDPETTTAPDIYDYCQDGKKLFCCAIDGASHPNHPGIDKEYCKPCKKNLYVYIESMET